MAEQGWPSGESAQSPPSYHLCGLGSILAQWVKFVLGSRIALRSFSPPDFSAFFLPLRKLTLQIAIRTGQRIHIKISCEG